MVMEMLLAEVGAAGAAMAIEKATDWFLVVGKEKFKNKHDWKKLFVDTGEFCIKNIPDAEALFEDMAEALSKDEMKQLAKDTSDANGYEFKNRLKKELSTIMQKHNVPYDVREICISTFIKAIVDEIEKLFPDKFSEIYLSDWRKEEKERLTVLTVKVNEVYEAISEIAARKLDICSLDQVELDLMNQTVNPKISLDFFELDDEQFQLQFEKRLYDECIYVSGKCKEEIIYCILNELRRIKDQRTVLVVKKHEDWEQLRIATQENENLNGKILIPWFYADEIIAIPNNTNIFVYGESDYCLKKNILKVRNRTRYTILKKLEGAGLEYTKACRLVEDTHGLYVPLKKKIFNGAYYKVPSWVNGDMKVVLPALLCGKWTENEGDIALIEFLADMKYEEFKEKLSKYINSEDPLLVRYTIRGTTHCQLASVENTWDYLDSKLLLDSELWKLFVDVIFDILIETNSVFKYPKEERQLKALTSGIGTYWSNDLKEGVLRSLIMKAFYRKNDENQIWVDKFVRKIMNEISNKEQWQSLSSYLCLLCEASPESVMRRLEAEWEMPTGLVDVFKEKPEYDMFSTYEYVNVLRTVELLLSQKQYTVRAIRWLLHISEIEIKYPFSNTPRNTLSDLLCAWVNLIPLTSDEKIDIANEIVKQHICGWDILYSALPGQKNSIIGELNKPQYRESDEPVKFNYEDMYKLYKVYLQLCLENTQGLSDRWIKIISEISKFPKEVVYDTFKQLKLEIQQMDDANKIKIKDYLRDEIYRHRYFANAEWSMGEEKIAIFEEGLKCISTDCKEYEYVYLFKRHYDFPLLNPIPFDREASSIGTRKGNERLAKDEIKSKMLLFKAKNLDIRRLIDLCGQIQNSTLGEYLFKYYCNENYDKALFEYMICTKGNEDIAIAYADYAYNANDSLLEEMISIANKCDIDSGIIARLYRLERNTIEGRVPLIISAAEQIKKAYWGIHDLFRVEKRMAQKLIAECKKYGTQQALFDLLGQIEMDLTSDEILDYFECATKLETGNLRLHSYEIKKLLERIQNDFIFTNNCFRVALIEIKYYKLFNEQMLKCLNHCLAIDPKYYAEMIAIIYLKEGEESTSSTLTEERELYISNMHSLFMDVEFCPGEISGHVEYTKIHEWVCDFKVMLENQNQGSLFTHLLGKVLANSSVGEDGYYPCEAVRDIIEEFGDNELISTYAMSIFNKRGVYSPTAGIAEMGMAEEYKEVADVMRFKYPKTAEIYKALHIQYKHEANAERERAEYECL